MKIISRFTGEYRFLSNFYNSQFEFEGHEYKNVETAYQERKTLDEERRAYIRESKTAFESAKRGRHKDTIIREGWFEGLKEEIMRELVFEKFKQNPDLLLKLIETGDAVIIEGNYWHDNYFGICNCKECYRNEEPKNILGQILMDVRKTLGEVQIKPHKRAKKGGKYKTVQVNSHSRKKRMSGKDIAKRKKIGE